MDTVGHEATHRPTKIHRKEDGEVVEKETVKEHRRVASPKEEKVEPTGKARVKEKKRTTSTRTADQWIMGTVVRPVLAN